MSDYRIKIDEREVYEVAQDFLDRPESHGLGNCEAIWLLGMFNDFIKFMDNHKLNKSVDRVKLDIDTTTDSKFTLL